MAPVPAASGNEPAEWASLGSAATVAREFGARVHVLVPRQAGVVTVAREIAAATGLRVEVDLRASTVLLSFECDYGNQGDLGAHLIGQQPVTNPRLVLDVPRRLWVWFQLLPQPGRTRASNAPRRRPLSPKPAGATYGPVSTLSG